MPLQMWTSGSSALALDDLTKTEEVSDEEKHPQAGDITLRTPSPSDRREALEATTGNDSPPVARRAPRRGTKRSVASVVQVEERADKDGNGKGKTSPQKAGKAVSHSVVHWNVVIPSPNSPPRQQRRVEEVAESKESDEETSTEPWVGRGNDRCESCKRLKLPACEPQWQSTRPFNSCKACKIKKTSCKPTNIWKEKVAMHNRTWVLRKGHAEDVGNVPETQAADDEPQSPPRQRRRIEEDAGREESEESEDAAEEISTKLWVGKGKDRCASCRDLNLPACEPQWQATRPFNSCKACKSKKKVCKPTQIWMKKVSMHSWSLREGSVHGKSITHDHRSDSLEPDVGDAPGTSIGSSAGVKAAGGRRGRRLPVNLKATNQTTNAAPPAVATNPQAPLLHDEIITAVDARIQAMGAGIETEISDLKTCIEGHTASLATLERTQQELRNMLLMLCGHQAITVASAAPSTSAVSPAVGISNPRVSGAAPAQPRVGTTSKAPANGQARSLARRAGKSKKD